MHISLKMCVLQLKCKCICDLPNAHLLKNKCALQPKCKCKCDPPNVHSKHTQQNWGCKSYRKKNEDQCDTFGKDWRS